MHVQTIFRTIGFMRYAIILSLLAAFTSCSEKAAKEVARQVEAAVSEAQEKSRQQSSVADGCLLPASADETLLRRVAYTANYNAETRQPDWVAWELTKEETRGEHNRQGINFQEDYAVSGRRATASDYSRSGYDRGHMCPSADCKWSADAQQQSFLLTNICPQDRELNAGAWNDLEQLCRKWARRYGCLHIVCGPVFYEDKATGRKTIGRNKIAVPDAFFKVVYRPGNNPQAIGFIYANHSQYQSLSDARRTVDEIESITGFDFYHQLPDNIENKVEAAFDEGEWR